MWSITQQNRCFRQRWRGLFDLLKTVEEATINELHSMFISVSDSEMDLSVECAADLSFLVSPNVTVKQEDGLWLVRTMIGGWKDA